MSMTDTTDFDDFLDGCELDFTIDPDDELTQSLRALYPDGQDVGKTGEWNVLFSAQSIVEEHLLKIEREGDYSGTGYDRQIANRLRAAGLKVVEIDGWQTRGSATFHPRGSVDHHTAGSANGNAPSLGTCINGRADLSGPLCNVLIGRDNTCYVIAAGRANHAGKGGWLGMSGNSDVYGVERENVGTSAEPWRDDQTLTAAKCHAALIRYSPKVGDAGQVCEHKEWAPHRKSDAHTLGGPEMRQRVAAMFNPEPSSPHPPSTEPEDMEMEYFYIIRFGDAPGTADDNAARYAWFPGINRKTFISADAFPGFRTNPKNCGELLFQEKAVRGIKDLEA